MTGLCLMGGVFCLLLNREVRKDGARFARNLGKNLASFEKSFAILAVNGSSYRKGNKEGARSPSIVAENFASLVKNLAHFAVK